MDSAAQGVGVLRLWFTALSADDLLQEAFCRALGAAGDNARPMSIS